MLRRPPLHAAQRASLRSRGPPLEGGLEKEDEPVMKRLLLAAAATLFVLPAGTAAAANRMPIGFFDDVSFRYSAARDANLLSAAATGASVIHTNVSWPAIAPTRPTTPSNGNDPAYALGNLTDRVFQSGLYRTRRK